VAHADHERVRQRYGQRCGYCGVSEVDTGSTLTVDHYQPIAAGGSEQEENLVYACFKCNQYKGDFSPNADDLAGKRRVLHPLYDDLAAYTRENRYSGELEPLNETGRFHFALLQLNRPALVEYRLRRLLAVAIAKKQQLLECENAQLRAIIAAQEICIAQLRGLLGIHPPKSG
jgi:hypothetical protein